MSQQPATDYPQSALEFAITKVIRPCYLTATANNHLVGQIEKPRLRFAMNCKVACAGPIGDGYVARYGLDVQETIDDILKKKANYMPGSPAYIAMGGLDEYTSHYFDPGTLIISRMELQIESAFHRSALGLPGGVKIPFDYDGDESRKWKASCGPVSSWIDLAIPNRKLVAELDCRVIHHAMNELTKGAGEETSRNRHMRIHGNIVIAGEVILQRPQLNPNLAAEAPKAQWP
jgi:hypothetical protein